jgi:CHAT domain-containing protein
MVENYLKQIANPKFDPARGLRVEAGDPERPLDPQRPELLADVVLPHEARALLKEWGVRSLIVVPDGPLHKLPFEALLLRAGDKPSYGLDELPPIAYAPSLAVLGLLAQRRPPARGAALSLLTVADPAYHEPRGDPPAGRTDPRDAAAFFGRLPRLEKTLDESNAIANIFIEEKYPIRALTDRSATERAAAAAVKGKRIVHIAAHGLADDRFGNQFGALALTPPPPGRAAAEDDDGFLSLHEIYALPLDDCELAVLSACVTNVGPQEPLEAGVTLASGFLAAGARRVVASHWSVADESTAELMKGFFKEVVDAARQGKPVPYSLALRAAQRKVRDQKDRRGRKDWSSPYFWAPFVLVGSAD